jgi:hypothetical protein
LEQLPIWLLVVAGLPWWGKRVLALVRESFAVSDEWHERKRQRELRRRD